MESVEKKAQSCAAKRLRMTKLDFDQLFPFISKKAGSIFLAFKANLRLQCLLDLSIMAYQIQKPRRIESYRIGHAGFYSLWRGSIRGNRL